MEYYIISLIISIIIFLFVYNKNVNEYENSVINKPSDTSMLSMKNILLFFIIYIVSTILSFYIFTSSLSFSYLSSLCPLFISNLLTIQPPANIDTNVQNYKELYNDEIDPKILSKINDNIDIGFQPDYPENENDSI